MVTEHLPITVISCVVCTMQENQFLLFLNHLRLSYSIPKSFALLLNIHVARHTFAMMALNGGVDIKTTSSLLGHASTMVTERVYATLLPNTIAEVVGDKLNIRLD